MDVDHLRVSSFNYIYTLAGKSDQPLWIAFKTREDAISFSEYQGKEAPQDLKKWLYAKDIRDLYVISTSLREYFTISIKRYREYYSKMVYMFEPTFNLGDIYE